MSKKVYVEQSAVLEALQAAINKQAGKPDALQFVSDILDAPFVPPAAEVATVEQRAKEQPEKKRKTYAEDFFEKFPKARKISDLLPAVCRNKIYGLPCHFNELESCATCWNEEMEDEDE